MKTESSFARAIVGFPTTSDSHAARNLKSSLRHIDGIISFTFDPANDKVDIVFDPKKADLKLIKKAIARASVAPRPGSETPGATVT